MAFNEITRFWPRSDFIALGAGETIDIQLFEQHLASVVLSTPPVAVLHLPGDAIRIDWETFPTAADLLAIDAAVASFSGGATTSEPFQYNSFAVATSSSSTPVVKIDETTPPLDAGTYQVIWISSLRMQAVAANTGVQADVTLTRSDGVSVHQDDAWNLSNRHAFNGALTFQVLAGQTIRSQLTFNRLGASGTAEMSGARITVDKIS